MKLERRGLQELQESDLRDLSHLRPVIQEIHVPARHLVYEIHSNARALDAGVFQGIQSAAAIEARFTLQILVIESHLFLKKSFELGHGSFQEGVLTDELDSFNTQNPANVRQPEPVFGWDGIRKMIRPAEAVRVFRDLDHAVDHVVDRHKI